MSSVHGINKVGLKWSWLPISHWFKQFHHSLHSSLQNFVSRWSISGLSLSQDPSFRPQTTLTAPFLLLTSPTDIPLTSPTYLLQTSQHTSFSPLTSCQHIISTFSRVPSNFTCLSANSLPVSFLHLRWTCVCTLRPCFPAPHSLNQAQIPPASVRMLQQSGGIFLTQIILRLLWYPTLIRSEMKAVHERIGLALMVTAQGTSLTMRHFLCGMKRKQTSGSPQIWKRSG